MGPEFITISGWARFKSVKVSRKFTHAAGSFSFEIAAGGDPGLTFAAGTAIDITSNGSLLLRAFVDRYKPKISRHKFAGASVSGRSRGQDFIDSSAIHKTGEFKNKTPAEIAQELDQFGVGISTDQQLDKVPIYRVTPGEGCHLAIEKMCRAQGVWQSGQADGTIKITVGGRGRNSPLIQGVNILEGEGDHNWSNRHSHVIVRGQRPVGHGTQSMEVEATSHDENLQRYRPVLVVHDDDTDNKRAKKRADHRRDSEVGNSLKANVEVQGFHDDGGELWTPGFLTFVDAPFLGISQDMAIDGVEHTQDRSRGSLTHIALVDPRALGAKGAKGGRKGGKSNSAWSNAAGGD